MTKNHFLLLLIALGFLAGLVSFRHRFEAEALNRQVELVIDYADAQALANTTRQQSDVGLNRQMDVVLTQLRQAGITTVAVTEQSLDSLRSQGVFTYRREGETTILTFAPGASSGRQRARVIEMLAHKTGLPPAKPVGADTLVVGAPWTQFNGIPVGLDGDEVDASRRNGLLVAPRLLNWVGINDSNIHWDLAQTQAQCATPQGMGPFIFAGSAVLGNRGLIPATANALAENNLTYGSVEFAKTFGDDDLARRAAASTVRVHSIGLDEMGTMDEPTAIERFVRAAKERNIRVCYVRLFTAGLTHDPDVLHANTEFVGKIVDGLREAHLETGGDHPAAHPYRTDPTPGLVLRLLMALGVVGGALLLLRLFTGLDGSLFWGVCTLALLLGLGLAVPGVSPKGREVLALLAACVFPTLGLCWFGRVPLTPNNGGIGQVFVAYTKITLVTLAGIVLIVGLLSGRLFLLKVDEFLGVKTVLVAPILLAAAFHGLGLAGLAPNAGWAARRMRVLQTVNGLAAQPLLLGQVVLGLVALAMLVLLVARSGNDPGVGVSPLELHMRALLDKYLLVRPRTKEFLLGHPALFLAMATALSGRFRRWTLPLLVIGAIGQSSLVDTFCHLHMPLYISMLRAVIGWVLGAVIGAIVWAIARRVVPEGRPSELGAGRAS